MRLFELSENLRNRPAQQLVDFKTHHQYFADGYKLSHFGIWKLTFKHMSIMSEKDPRFWEIISMYDFKTIEITDTIGTDLKPSDWEPPDIDTNFFPSLGCDWEVGEPIIRPFPIWEWNEYIDEQLMPIYKIG